MSRSRNGKRAAKTRELLQQQRERQRSGSAREFSVMEHLRDKRDATNLMTLQRDELMHTENEVRRVMQHPSERGRNY